MIFRIVLFSLFTFFNSLIFSQDYEVLHFNFNGTPANGIKIRTNIPYSSSSQMPTVKIEGYAYGTGKTIGLLLNWYIYSGSYTGYSVSSFGGYAPPIFLSNENGKVVIFINDRGYYHRFKVNAFVQGMGELSSWFQDWTFLDEQIFGTNTVELPYVNVFKGSVGVGVSNPSALLHLAGERQFTSSSIGTIPGNIHFNPPVNYHSATGITFGGSGAASDQSQAGIYVQSAGSYGTKMFLATTNNYSLGSQSRVAIDHDGNVGFGVDNPCAKLHVSGERIFSVNSIGTQAGNLHFNPPVSYHNATSITFGGSGSSNNLAQAGIYIQSAGSYGTKMIFGTTNNFGLGSQNRMIIDHDGNVGIGSTIPSEKLTVNGNIRAKKLIVSQQNWSDYVFYKGYKLRPLNELEKYIEKYQHLPDVPSTKEVQSKGINVGDAQAILLKKIEELTLYIIELKKENIDLNNRLNKLELKN
jgi:hypothetical protein